MIMFCSRCGALDAVCGAFPSERKEAGPFVCSPLFTMQVPNLFTNS